YPGSQHGQHRTAPGCINRTGRRTVLSLAAGAKRQAIDMSTAIQANGLVIGHQGHAISKPLDFALGTREILCVLGPNGCGKSTLFKTLIGLLPAINGELNILGTPMQQWTRRTFARRVGYVPQAQEGMFPFTVEEMVLMGRTAHL